MCDVVSHAPAGIRTAGAAGPAGSRRCREAAARANAGIRTAAEGWLPVVSISRTGPRSHHSRSSIARCRVALRRPVVLLGRRRAVVGCAVVILLARIIRHGCGRVAVVRASAGCGWWARRVGGRAEREGAAEVGMGNSSGGAAFVASASRARSWRRGAWTASRGGGREARRATVRGEEDWSETPCKRAADGSGWLDALGGGG